MLQVIFGGVGVLLSVFFAWAAWDQYTHPFEQRFTGELRAAVPSAIKVCLCLFLLLTSTWFLLSRGSQRSCEPQCLPRLRCVCVCVFSVDQHVISFEQRFTAKLQAAVPSSIRVCLCVCLILLLTSAWFLLSRGSQQSYKPQCLPQSRCVYVYFFVNQHVIPFKQRFTAELRAAVPSAIKVCLCVFIFVVDQHVIPFRQRFTAKLRAAVPSSIKVCLCVFFLLTSMWFLFSFGSQRNYEPQCLLRWRCVCVCVYFCWPACDFFWAEVHSKATSRSAFLDQGVSVCVFIFVDQHEIPLQHCFTFELWAAVPSSKVYK